MSALCQKRTHAPQQKGLFDHFVGAGEERLGNCKPKRLSGLEVDDQRVFGGLLERRSPTELRRQEATIDRECVANDKGSRIRR